MTHFKVIGWCWLIFGALGFLNCCRVFAMFMDHIFLSGGQWVLIPVILGCVFTLGIALTGFGLLRRWRWARIAVEILGTILFAYPVIVFLFEELNAVGAVVAAFAFYSVLVALFVRYEPPPNTTLEPTATAP